MVGAGGRGGRNGAATRRSPPFRLTSGRLRLQWTIRPLGASVSGHPRLVVTLPAVNPVSDQACVENPLAASDTYGSFLKVVDEGQASGRYGLSVSAMNCGWKVTVWQERWS